MKLTREEFLALQKHWYEKAKESGFKDIELSQESRVNLNEAVRIANEEYFTLITHKAHDPDTHFKNDVDRFIMLHHAEGEKIRDIMKGLECLGLSKDRKNVRLIIRRYAEKWKISYYKKKF